MQTEIYLDNSATTKPCKTVVDCTVSALTNNWGNPSSLHKLGIDAENLIADVRHKTANLLNCRDDCIFFTGSGTEANNLCISGAVEGMKRRGNRIITTSVEHPSVLNTCKHLEQNGFEVIYVKPHSDGNIYADDILSFVNDNTILVSVMLVNNETGCIFPISKIAYGLKQLRSHSLLHSDCVQAFGKMNIDTEDLGADLISASGHKIHGPKGMGFFYKSKTANIKPLVFGGGQEKGLRSGTEPVPLIAAFGGALDELNIQASLKDITSLHKYAAEKLQAIDGIIINSPLSGSLPYIINISVKRFRSETLLHFLESKGIYVSSGSACAKGKGSHVLTEMGLSTELTDSALRISFSRYNKATDIDALCDALKEAQNKLRSKGN